MSHDARRGGSIWEVRCLNVESRVGSMAGGGVAQFGRRGGSMAGGEVAGGGKGGSVFRVEMAQWWEER